MIPAWIAQVMKLMRPLIPKDFVGQVEVNVYKGGISNINIKQSFKEEDKTI